jgi:hypothetical protein
MIRAQFGHVLCSFGLLVLSLPCSLAAQTLGDEARPPAIEPHYVIEIRMFSIPCNKDDQEFPEALQSLALQLDPKDVEVFGGAFIDGEDNEAGIARSTPDAIATGDSAASELALPTGQAMLCLRADDSMMEEFTNLVKSDSRANIMTAPGITVAVNTPANVMDGSERAFCAALIPDESGVRNVFRYVFEGMRYRVSLKDPTEEGIELAFRFDQSQVTSIRNLSVSHPFADRAPVGKDAGNNQIQVPCVECDSRSLKTRVRFGETTLAVTGWKERERRVEKGVPVPGLDRVFRNVAIEKESHCQLLSVRVVPVVLEDAGAKRYSLGDSSQAVPILPIR